MLEIVDCLEFPGSGQEEERPRVISRSISIRDKQKA